MIKKLLTILALLLVCGYAQAAEWGVIDIPDFSGGLNTRDGAGGIADNELSQSVNCYLLAKGIAKRNGYVEYNDSARVSTTARGTGIVYAPFIAGAKIVATAGTKIAYQGTNVWTDITGSVTITADYPFMWTVINDNIVGVNGHNKPIYWDGTGNADSLSGTNIPTAPVACETFHGRLFLAQDNKIYWSNYLGAWTTFHPDDYQTFGDDVVGLKVYGSGEQSVLIILTESSVYACRFDAYMGATIGGRGVFTFDAISNSHGCVSGYSVQECLTADGQIVLIWADTDGLKALLPGNTIIELTDKIQDDWNALSFTTIWKSIGIHYKAKNWYLFVCNSGSGATNDKVIVFDLRNWCVAGIFDWTISAMNTVRSSGEDLLIGSNYDGYWHQYDSGYSDGGTAISATFRTKSFDNNDALFDKAFLAVGVHHAYIGNYDFDITAFFDYSTNSYTTDVVYEAPESGNTILGSWLLGDGRLTGYGGFIISGNQITGRGKSVMVQVKNDDINESFEVYRIQVPYEKGRVVIYQ